MLNPSSTPLSLSPDHLERPPRYRQEKQKHGRHARERKEPDKKGRKQKTDDERIAWKKAEQDGKNRKENEEHMQIARAKAEKNHKSQNDEKYQTPHKSVSELIWRGGGFGAAAPLDTQYICVYLQMVDNLYTYAQ